MKPDQLDIKIKEAAEQYESVYNEEAWDAMEKLLDEKMPQKKDKRKVFWILILFLLLLGVSSLLFINYTQGDKEKIAVSAEKSPASASRNTAGDNSNVIKKPNKETAQSSLLSEPNHSKSSFKKLLQSTWNQEKTTREITANNKAIKNAKQTNDLNNKSDHQTSIPDKNNLTEEFYNSQNNQGKKSQNNEGKKDTIANGDNRTVENEETNLLVQNNDKDVPIKKINAPGKENKFINSFALSFSLGPDVSAVGLSNIGKIKPAYGAGISYQISQRLTLRTGFYVEKKVYDADVPDYHPPARFWNYYPNLEYIDADCRIYEVPLIINYNFSQTQKHQWFGSAGISSYFMKKEDYNFFSKNPSGQTWYNSYTVNNKNKHYLSSIRLSAGYERKLNNKISILAEPYLNLPLTGVGYGKIKLYSSGVLLTVNVKPFAKK
jgi:hypothetical protein